MGNYMSGPTYMRFLFIFCLLKILFIYLTERETEHRQGELQTDGEPNVGLNPRTLGSSPELKADT